MGQTADQVREIADLFAGMSATVDSYRSQHFSALTVEERLRLEQLFQQLCDLRDQFTALAIEDTLEAIQSDLKQIVSVTSEAQRSLKQLNTVSEIASLASAAVELGADITIGDYGAVPQAIEDLVQASRKKPGPTAAAGNSS